MNNGPVDHLARPIAGPKRPPSWRWERADRDIDLAPLQSLADGIMERWRRGRIIVVSSLELADFNGELRWQWQVSVSISGQRCLNPDVLARVLRDFDMAGAEEDNHQPGVARNFWRLCDSDPASPSQCECKSDETTIVEPDGFTWQREGA